MPNEQKTISPQTNSNENQPPQRAENLLQEEIKEEPNKISPAMAIIGIVAVILMWLISTKIF